MSSRRPVQRTRSARARLRLVAALAVLLAPSSALAASQSPQPTGGPGGSATPYSEVRVSAGGSGASAWYVFEPVTPRKATLPVAVVSHGWGEFSGNTQLGELARHTAKNGNIVIYTRWQDGPVTPCPGPFQIKGCVEAAARGIQGALASIKATPSRNQVDLSRASYFGFSFGGIITANLAARSGFYGIPTPRAVFLDDPHDGGFTFWEKEYALADSLAGIPSTTKFVCHVGAEGVTTKSTDYSCGAVFPRIAHIPAANKSLVMSFPDDHGAPALSSAHGVCSGPGGGSGIFNVVFPVDTYDWGFCWRTFDALQSCAYEAKNCQYALGNTPQNRYMGTWSDGVPVIGLKVQTAAPITAAVIPARQPAP